MKNRKGHKFFVSINCNWNGASHVFSFPSLYCQDAKHHISYMAKYLAMEYAPSICSSFLHLSCCYCRIHGLGC